MKVLFSSPIKYPRIIFSSNRDIVALQNIIISSGGACQKRFKSCDKDKCCNDPAPGQGKTGDPNPSAPWRSDCPPNYDAYKIKVPNIMVPPLPPCNAKETNCKEASTVFESMPIATIAKHQFQDMFRNTSIHHPNYWQAPPKSSPPPEPTPKLGYHGKNKYMYAFHEPWRPLDRLALLAQAETNDSKAEQKLLESKVPMLECAKTKGPCSVQAPPPDPPCPPPPKKPFPWIYVWPWAVFLVSMGAIYKMYLLREKWVDVTDSKPIWRPRGKIKRPYHAADLPPCVQYLLVGGGIAAWSAYQAIKKFDANAKVFFISKEDCMPYYLPPMSKAFWWQVEPPDMKNLNYTADMKRQSLYILQCKDMMNATDFYRSKGPAMSIATGWCVHSIDPDNHVAYVNVIGGLQPIYYERCLIATGSKPVNLDVFKTAPKAVRDKTITFRTIRDLEIAFRKVRASQSVTIIGGGVLGCELAWYMGKSNDPKIVDRAAWDATEPPPDIEYNLIYKDKGVLSGFLPSYLGEYIAEKIRCENVNMIPNAQVYDAFTTPDDRLELTLSNGKSIVTDYVIVAIGAEPRVELAERSGLEVDDVNGGYVSNTEMMVRTHLYAAGDAASYYIPWKNTRIRVPHYDNAVTSGYVAGTNMTGKWVVNDYQPHYMIGFGNLLQIEVLGEVGACLQTVGLWKDCEVDENEREDLKKIAKGGELPCFKDAEYQVRYKRGLVFYLRDNIIVGLVIWNVPPVANRREVVEEFLRASPTYKDINMISELLGLPQTECSFKREAEAEDKKPLCLRGREW